MSDETINIKVLLDTANSAKSIQETRRAIKDLSSAALQVGENSAEFQQLTQAAGELKDRVDDTRQAVKFFSDDMKNLSGVIDIAKGVAAGFEVAQASIALFGGEGTKVEKMLLKVQSAMALLNGIQAVAQVLNKASTANLFIQNAVRTIAIRLTSQQAVAEAAEAAAAGTATIAQRALNAAMAANPIGILITLILAGAAALTLWTSSSDEAAAAQEKLNTELEYSLEVQALLSERRKQAATDQLISDTAGIKRTIDNVQKELDLLELKTNKTEANNKEIARLNKQLFDLNQDLRAKDVESTIANLDIDSSETQKSIDGKLKMRKLYKEELLSIADELANGEFQVRSRSDNARALELIKLLDDNKLEVASEQNKLKNIGLARTKAFSDDYTAREKAIKDREVLDAKEAQRIQDAIDKAEMERRKRLLESINDELSRRKDANGKILQLTAEQNDNLKAKELELQDISYGKQKESLIDASTRLELKRNEDKFTALKISQADFLAEKDRLEKVGYEHLSAQEKALYDLYVTNNTKITGLIEQRYANEASIAIANTASLNAELIVLDLSYAKQLELIKAEEITNEEEKNVAILAINDKYRAQEIDANSKALAANEAQLTASYQAAITDKTLTDEKKLELEAQYQLDLKKLRGDAALQEAQSNAVLIKNTEKDLKAKKDAWTTYYQQLASEIINLFAQINANITAGNVSVIDLRRAAALKAFEDEYQAYQNMTDKKTNAEQAKADKEKEFADKKAAIEADYDKQKQEVEYQGAVRAWEYSIAQAAISGAGFILKAGEQVGLPGAAAAAILAGIQLATIMSNPPQKYATGGLIKGEGTGTSDSIHTMLSNGESVINAKSTAMFLPMLDMINQAGGGAPLMNGGIKMSTGGIINNVNNNQVDTTRIEQVLEAYLSRPIKTYVTSSDVTNGQRSDNRLKSRTSF